MTTGWPQNQQDLRWPYSENKDTGPAAEADGRDDGEQSRGSVPRPDTIAAEQGKEHPSGPLPVGPMPPGGGPRGTDSQPQRGRFGRGKSRDGGREAAGPEDALAGDADYDWIKYLGEAGPAQETRRRGAVGGAARSHQDPAPPSSSPAPVNPAWADAGDDLRSGRGRRGAARTGPEQARLAPPDRLRQPSQAEPDTDARPSQSWPTFAPPAPESRPGDLSRDAGSRDGRSAGDRSGGFASPRAPFSETSAFSDTSAFSGTSAFPSAVPPGRAGRDSGIRDVPGREFPGREPAGHDGPGAPRGDRPGRRRLTRHPADADRHDSAPADFDRPDAGRADFGRADFDHADFDHADGYQSVRDRGVTAPADSGPDGGGQRDQARTARGSRRAAAPIESPAADGQARRFGRSRGAAMAGAPAAALPADKRLASRPEAGPDAEPAQERQKRRTPKPGKVKKVKTKGKAGTDIRPAGGEALQAGGLAAAAAPSAPAARPAPPARTPAVTGRPVPPAPAESLPSAAAAVTTAPSRTARTATQPVTPGRTARRSAGKSPRRGLTAHPVRLAGGAVTLVVLAVVGVLVSGVLSTGGPVHAITTPAKVMDYVQAPNLAKSLGVPALRAEIIQKGNGEASNVKYAVYEDSTGPGTSTGPLIVLFVGGNLSGSASSFISSFKGLLPSAFATSPGALAGQAACVPGVHGDPAECAWADNDTFGFIASPDLSASALAIQLRLIRPQVEHVVVKH
jgi:hypothetical protein